ncbi:MAG TPA: hypothetical protein VF017_08115 [Thermoanaerobaculia bacterium]|nr:hypothetical protein [Thermoanaerobaculia bacterium]
MNVARSMVAVALSALVIGTSAPLGAQAPTKFNITVVRGDGSERQLVAAELQEYRSSSYVGRTGDFPITSLGITAPITPPEGVKLTPRSVSVATIQRIDWAPGTQKGGTEHTPATITYRDGKVEKVLLWRTDNTPMWNTLALSTLSVRGSMNLEGQQVDVTVQGPFKSMVFSSAR